MADKADVLLHLLALGGLGTGAILLASKLNRVTDDPIQRVLDKAPQAPTDKRLALNQLGYPAKDDTIDPYLLNALLTRSRTPLVVSTDGSVKGTQPESVNPDVLNLYLGKSGLS